MLPDCLYRHVNNSTVAFEIDKQNYIPEQKAWSLRVCWWNVGACHTPYPLGISQWIKLPDSVHADWIRMEFGDRAPAVRHLTI